MSQTSLELIEELIAQQKKRLLSLGRQSVPTLTEEDVLQPMDYPQLEYDPRFRHEEGILEGMQTVYAALSAHKAACSHSPSNRHDFD